MMNSALISWENTVFGANYMTPKRLVSLLKLNMFLILTIQVRCNVIQKSMQLIFYC